MELSSTNNIRLAKAKSELSIDLYSLIYPCLLLVLIVCFGYGTYTDLGRYNRWLLTLVVIAPIIVMGFHNPARGLCIAAGSIIPFDILMNNGFVTYATLHLIIFAITLFMFSEPKRNKLFQGGRIIGFIFIVIICLQLSRAIDLVLGVQKLLDCVDVILILYICLPKINNSQLKNILNSYTYGVVLSMGFVLITNDWSTFGRLGKTLLLNPNNIGIPCSLALIYLRYLQTTKRIGCWVWLIAAFLMLALLLTSSRGAILSFLAGIMVLSFVQGKLSKLLGSILLLGLTILILFNSVFLESPIDVHLLKGLDSTSASSDVENSMGLRWRLLIEGIALFESSPIVGVGWTNFAALADVHHGQLVLPAHNMFLGVGAELGITGLLVLLAWLLGIFRYAFRQKRYLGLAMSAAMLVWGLTHGNFLSAEIALVWPATLGIVESPIPKRPRVPARAWSLFFRQPIRLDAPGT